MGREQEPLGAPGDEVPGPEPVGRRPRPLSVIRAALHAIGDGERPTAETMIARVRADQHTDRHALPPRTPRD